MGVCDRCARLLCDFKMKTAHFVYKVNEATKTMSKCSCMKDKLYEPLQRSEMTTKQRRPALFSAQSYVPTAFLEACFSRLQSEDVEVQRSASLSLFTFLRDCKIKEEHAIELGVLEPLIDLLQSDDCTVQCNSSACIALLACSDSNREAIVVCNGLLPLLVLAKAFDPKVQRNAVRALFNLTKSASTRSVLCEEGVIPVLAPLLQSADTDVQFYSCSALSNIAAVSEYHTRMLQIGNHFLLKSLVSLMGSFVLKNSTQACQCLRSLAGNGEVQQQLMGLDWMYPLLTLLKAPELNSSQAALMLLSQLSAHTPNRELLVNQDILTMLGDLLLTYISNPTVVTHCTLTFTHLWSSVDSQQAVLNAECLYGLLLALKFDWNEDSTLLSVLSCLQSMACYDSLWSHLTEKMTAVHVARLVTICSESETADVSFTAASVISKLDMNDKLLKPHHRAIERYLIRFLRSQKVRFQQLAIVSVYNLRKGGGLQGRTCGLGLEQELNKVQQQTEHTRHLLEMLQQDISTKNNNPEPTV